MLKTSFYEEREYQSYTKLQLLTQGGVSSKRLGVVAKTINKLNSAQNEDAKPLLNCTSRQTADRLIRYELYDLDTMETCWCIQNLFGPKSVFTIYHDESTESAVSFLVTLLSFRPDPSPEFSPIPKLHGGTFARAICSSELSDKTAGCNSNKYNNLSLILWTLESMSVT